LASCGRIGGEGIKGTAPPNTGDGIEHSVRVKRGLKVGRGEERGGDSLTAPGLPQKGGGSQRNPQEDCQMFLVSETKESLRIFERVIGAPIEKEVKDS